MGNGFSTPQSVLFALAGLFCTVLYALQGVKLGLYTPEAGKDMGLLVDRVSCHPRHQTNQLLTADRGSE